MKLKRIQTDQEKRYDSKKTFLQRVWGVMLVLAGVGVFFRIPQVMPKIEKIEQFSSVLFFIQFCFYFIGVLLIGGGSKKIYDSYQKIEGRNPNKERIRS
ncbi:MAG: hypothetical protein JRI99_07635 [Deltaproteobacteria bacterium]|nr:hypothetical protein [Deltaproteobacteria bacterium]MBW2539862.1 hypothetical protein [Deltaproteobacteria bacterium]